MAFLIEAELTATAAAEAAETAELAATVETATVGGWQSEGAYDTSNIYAADIFAEPLAITNPGVTVQPTALPGFAATDTVTPQEFLQQQNNQMLDSIGARTNNLVVEDMLGGTQVH